jgi:hypothetical protein
MESLIELRERRVVATIAPGDLDAPGLGRLGLRDGDRQDAVGQVGGDGVDVDLAWQQGAVLELAR